MNINLQQIRSSRSREEGANEGVFPTSNPLLNSLPVTQTIVVVYPQTSSKLNVTCVLYFRAHAEDNKQKECLVLFSSVFKIVLKLN